MSKDMFNGIDWGELFGLSVPAMELVIRGSAMYWFLFLIFRFVIRRDVGSVGIADILVLLIVADAAQNGMSGEYTSITEGMILVSTLIGWNFLLDVLSYKFPTVRRLMESPPLLLVKDGKMLPRNMRKEYITEEELRSKFREQGIDSIGKIKMAFIEPDGEISVIRKKE
jgi:uncharacterized membrane protein YcaP (DUF421 family)